MSGSPVNPDVVIGQAVSKTFENMVFSPIEEPSFVWTKLDTLSPVKMEFVLLIPDKLAHSLAGNLGGVEGQDMAEAAVLDCAAEMLNTLVGQFLENVLSPDVEFALSLPKSGVSSSFEFPASTKIYTFQLDGENFFIGVSPRPEKIG